MILRRVEPIWHVKGSVPLAPGQTSADAFERLDPLFRQYGTTHERENDTLRFNKKDQAAQDKMSVFDSGILRVETGDAGSVLVYDLTSRALLFCFLLPLLFVGIAQLTIVTAKPPKPAAEAAGKAAGAAKKSAAEKAEVPMNAIDKALGAPAPDNKKKKDGDEGKRKKKPSPTPAYVFAGIFAALYAIGRVLEAWLIKRLFRKSLLGG